MRKYLSVTTTLVFGSFLSLLGALFFQEIEYNRAHHKFKESALEHVEVIYSTLQSSLYILHSLAAFYEAVDPSQIKQGTFDTFTTDLLSHHPPGLSLLWAPRVSQEHKTSFETHAQREYPHFKILSSLERQEYFPIYYHTTLRHVERQTYGFDLTSEPAYREVLARARNTKIPQATSHVTSIIKGFLDQESVVIFYPTFTQIDLQEELRGFVVGVLKIKELIEEPLRSLNKEKSVYVVIEEESNKGKLLYTNYPLSQERASGSLEKLSALMVQAFGKQMFFRQTFEIAGSLWTILCAPATYPAGNHLWIALSILLSGLLGTLLISAYILEAFKYTMMLQREIKERQHVEYALQQAQEQLKEYNHTLEQRVAQRTQQLADKNLRLQQEIHERRKVETTLRKSEKKFNTILDHIPAFIHLQAPDLSIKFANRYFIERFGDPHHYPCYNMMNQGSDDGESCPTFHVFKDPSTPQIWEMTLLNQRTYQIYDYPFMEEDHGLLVLELGIDITERKQAEEALRISKERFDLAMQGAHEGLWDWNLENNTVYFSPRWKEMLGYSDQELPNELSQWESRVHPEDFSRVMSAIEAYLDRKIATYEVVHRLRHKHGHDVWILVRGMALWNIQGNPTRFVGTHVDLTVQKQAEEALRESERHWRTLIFEARIGLLLSRLDGSTVEVNPAFTQIVGYTVEEFRQHQLTFFDISLSTHAANEREDIHKLQSIFSGQLSYEEAQLKLFVFKDNLWRFGPFEVEFIHREGHRVPIRASGVIIERNGEHFIWANAENITDKKQADKALRQSEERMRSYFELPLVGVVMTSPSKEWLEVNDKFCDILGYSREELKLLTWPQFTHPDDLDKNFELFNQMISGKIEGYTVEKRYVHKNGQIIYAILSVRGVRCADHSIEYIIAVIQDITIRKQVEIDLKEKEEFLRLVMDNIPQLIFWKDLNSVFLGCNKKVAQLNQLNSQEDIIGKTDFELIWNDKAEYCRTTDRQVMESDTPQLHFMETLRQADGQQRWVKTNKIPLHHVDGSVMGILTTIEDITEQLHAEILLREYSRTLEQEVHDRTSELKDKETFLRLLIDNLPQHISWQNQQLIYLGCNQAFAQFLHFNHPDQIVGKTVHDLLSSPFAKLFEEQSHYVMETGIPMYHYVEYIRDSHGEEIWFESNKIPLHDSQGKMVGILITSEDITGRKRSEEALRESEAQLNEAQRIAHLGYWEWDILNKNVCGSEEVFKHFGFPCTTEKLPFAKFIGAIHPEDQDMVQQKIDEAFCEDKPYQAEFRIIRPNEEICYVQSFGKVVFDNEDKPLRLLGTVQDITERKLAEIAVRESEARFRAIFNNAAVAIAIVDLTGRFLQINDKSMQMLGYSREELLHLTSFDLTYYEDLNPARERFTQLVTGQVEYYSIEKRYICKNNKPLWTNMWASPLRNAQGQIQMILGIAVDINQSKQAELALAESERRFRQMADSAPVMIWVSGIDKLCYYFNKGWLEFTGHSLEQEVGHGWESAIHPDDYDYCLETYHYAFEDRQPFTTEYRLRRYDGQYRWVLDNGVPRLTDDGEFIGYIGSCIDITHRKETLEALRESEARLKAIFENSAVGIVLATPQGQLVHCNTKWLEMFGYTLEEIHSLTYINVTYPEDREQSQFHYEMLINKVIESYHIEKRFLKKHGESFWADASVTSIYNENEALQMVIGIIVDITSRKQAQELRIQTQNRLEFLLRYTPAIIYACRAFGDYEVTFISDNIQQLGYTPQEFLSDPGLWTRYLHPEDQAGVLNGLVGILEKSSYEHEYRFLCKQGSYFWIHDTIRVIRDEHGRPIELLGVWSDITERKKIEEALRKSEERFELAMRGANDGLWDWNIETGEIYFSPRWKQMLGFSTGELRHHIEAWRALIYPDDLEQVIHSIETYFQNKTGIYENVYRMKHKENYFIWILIRGMAVWNDQGQPLRFVGTHVDLTAQKQAEEALRQAKEAAEVANQAKSTFLANMSHELRTPLNGILGFAQIFKNDTSLTKEQLEGVNIILKSGNYLLTLINDILDLSKIEAGRIEFTPIALNVEDFIKGVVEVFKIRAQQKNIGFDYQSLSPLPNYVYADEKRLRQILINLLGNAIKFTMQGQVSLKVSYTQHNETFHFKVMDTGMGIATTDLEKIFLPFQQVGDKTYWSQGTGLGLSITKKLVEMMEGKLEVKSTQGVGSTFWLELKLPEVKGSVRVKAPQARIIGFHGPSRKILLVDDRWENLAVLSNLLTPLGFEVIEALNSQDGLDKVYQHHPDLVILDLMMPHVDGFEFARRVKQTPEIQDIVMIAASASVFEHHKQESLAAGCHDFISKPIRSEELFECFQRCLGIEWIYDTAHLPNKDEEIDLSHLRLPAHQAIVLDHLAKSGDIKGILKQADDIEKMDQQLQPLVNKIRQLADEFEDEQIRELVKPFIC